MTAKTLFIAILASLFFTNKTGEILQPIIWADRWPDFLPHEVLSPAGIKHLETRGDLLVQPHALDFLQQFRAHLDKPIKVNHAGLELRGYRSPGENKRCGGRMFSYHMQGLAFDISVDDLSPVELAKLAIEYGWHGIGVYGTFVHVDVAARKIREGRQTVWIERQSLELEQWLQEKGVTDGDD